MLPESLNVQKNLNGFITNKNDLAGNKVKSCGVGDSYAISGILISKYIKREERNQMSYTPQEQREHRAIMALELMAFKAKVAMAEAQESNYHYTPSISMEDLNECFVVAGMPLIVPGSTKEKELDVIEFDKEDEA